MNEYQWLEDEHGVEVKEVHSCEKSPNTIDVVRDQESIWHVITESNFQYSLNVIHCPYCGVKLEENNSPI